MIKSYSSKANLGILAGLVLSLGGGAIVVGMAGSSPNGPTPGILLAAVGLRLLGLGLFIYGCVMYALGKGRSGAWGAFGLLSLIGLVVLVCLKDYAKDGYVAEQRGFPVGPRVGPPSAS